MVTQAKILVIDDDADIVEAMRLMLESKGYAITSASSYEEGLAGIRTLRPDLVILDVMLMLNEKNGFELSYEIRKDPAVASIPILMVTAINAIHPGFEYSPETDDEYLPVDAFINKPVQPEDLYQKVETLLKMKTSKWVNWPAKPQ